MRVHRECRPTEPRKTSQCLRRSQKGESWRRERRSGSQRPGCSRRLQSQKGQGTAEKRVNNVRCTLIANPEEFTILPCYLGISVSQILSAPGSPTQYTYLPALWPGSCLVLCPHLTCQEEQVRGRMLPFLVLLLVSCTCYTFFLTFPSSFQEIPTPCCPEHPAWLQAWLTNL